MNQAIRVERAAQSRLPSLDFSNLSFGGTFSDHMFQVDYVDGAWRDARISPYGPIELLPANMALQYGQSIFEGMKATRAVDGRVLLFRTELHGERLNHSAARLAMQALPVELFQRALHQLVELDKAWVPEKEGSALYIRPFMFATDATVGVRPSRTYKFMIVTCPVGPYYDKRVKLLADRQFVRAAQGGTGEAKAAGNYAASMLPALLAQERGYDQVLWLDAKEFRYIQEVGTMNIFFVIDGVVLTPELSGTILHGITRRTIIELLREEGYAVEERRIDLQELLDASKAGTFTEAFGSGTAAVISYVDRIRVDDEEITMPLEDETSVGVWVKDRMQGIRAGRYPDRHGWLEEVGAPATVETA